MTIIRELHYYLINIQNRLKVPSVENILWMINCSPQWAGFSILEEKNSVMFWIVHFVLMFYFFFLSNVVYGIKFSKELGDIVKANTILSLIIMTLSSDFWFLTKRKLLISTLKKVKALDGMSQKNEGLLGKYRNLLSGVKNLVLGFYVVNFFNSNFVYMPQRLQYSSAFSSLKQCPGFDITTEVRRNICNAIAVSQDLSIMIVVLNYQAVLLFIIGHTTCMYRMLSDEMIALKDIQNHEEALLKERLSLLIKRHSLLLDIVQRLRSLYNMPIGINFGTNAYIICLYFSLPLEEWISFAPIFGYCIVIFFLYCYLCQKLINASIDFESSVYDCGWESYDMSDKKAIYIVLKLAQKPVLLLAADLIPVNIYTFATAVQFIFKLVTVLKF